MCQAVNVFILLLFYEILFCTLTKSPIQISNLCVVERYLKILDDMTMVRIYVKTSTSTINVANHQAKGGGCDINFLTFKKEGGVIR